MTLLNGIDGSTYKVERLRAADGRQSSYAHLGLRRGRELKLLCRHPAVDPLFFECELDNELRLSVPVDVAATIFVRLEEAAGTGGRGR